MSKKDAVPLHIEWTPGWVRAVNIATGDRAEAVTLKKLGQITIGQKEALVGIGRKIVFLKAIRLPKALPDDLRRIIGVQLGQFFPLSGDQLSFDFAQTPNQNQEGLLTIVAAIRADDLRLLHSELKEVGLSASRILPIALASAVVAAKSSMVDALVIESDHGDVALDVVQGGFLRYSRLTPGTSDLAIESKRTLAAVSADNLPSLRAGEARNGCLELLHEALPLNFELSESRVLNAKKQTTFRARLAAVAVAAAVIVVAMVWSGRQQQMTVLQQAKDQSTKMLTQYQSRESDQSAETLQDDTLRTDLDQTFAPGQKLSDISSFVSDSLPSSSWLTGLTLERAKQAQIRGTAMESNDVAGFEQALGASPRFANIKLIFANSAMIGTTQVIQFNVTADCVGNLPMPSPLKDNGNVQTASSVGSDQNMESGG